MFIQLIRIFFTLENGTIVKNHSTQYFMLDDYTSVDSMMLAVQARYHNVIAADLQNTLCIYNAAYIIDNAGTMLNHDVFDRRGSVINTSDAADE